MPATFESFGIKFLYPDNWIVAQRDPEEGDHGLTLELPGGGFFSVERDDEDDLSDEELLAKVCETIHAEYEDAESEPVTLDNALEGERAVDLRFFYLDLLIVSRVILMKVDGARLLIQIQAENRDFDTNAMVFAAILQQIRGLV